MRVISKPAIMAPTQAFSATQMRTQVSAHGYAWVCLPGCIPKCVAMCTQMRTHMRTQIRTQMHTQMRLQMRTRMHTQMTQMTKSVRQVQLKRWWTFLIHLQPPKPHGAMQHPPCFTHALPLTSLAVKESGV